jgi:ATP-binding cassette subfamily B protein
MPGDGERSAETPALRALPADVRRWVRKALGPNEAVAGSLFADIAPGGKFGEHWAFLTNRRLFVLSPNGKEDEADLGFEMPLNDIQGARLDQYVGSSALIVTAQEQGHEVVRFSMNSHPEASALCHRLNEVVRLRDTQEGDEIPPPPVRPTHRCQKCGRALRRQGGICPHCIDRRKVLTRLLSLLMNYRTAVLGGLTLTLIVTAVDLMPPYLTKVLVDDVIDAGNPGLLPVVVGLLVGAYVGRAVVMMFRSYVMQWLGNRFLFDLRVHLFDHMQMLPLTYYDQRATGHVMNRITHDLGRIQYFVTEGFQEILVNIVTVFLIAGILLALDWQLFLLALAPVPIILASTVVFGQRIHSIYHRIWRRVSGISAILADTIPGIRVVKSFAQEGRESRRFSSYSSELFTHQMRAVKVTAAFFPFLNLMTGSGSILIFGVGGYMVLSGRTSLGVLMAFTGYLWRLYMPVQRFGWINNRLQRCATSAERVFEMMDSETEPIDQQGGVILSPLRGRVEFRNVRFAYEPAKYALDDVSFAVEPGEMIGLVGPSGAGKSTLVQLIMRFYSVDEGQILIDGNDIEDLSLTPYREQIGVVLQHPYLFHGTVWDNISYAKPDASPDEVIEAARAANCHGFIVDLPDGYDTVIGERGQTLSGGERQRMSIARAILRDPRILILDEATASVDTETEMLIQTALERLIQNRTTFAIAHRLSTLRRANRLMCLERGKLLEMGTHEELLANEGLYSRLCKLQAEVSKLRAW